MLTIYDVRVYAQLKDNSGKEGWWGALRSSRDAHFLDPAARITLPWAIDLKDVDLDKVRNVKQTPQNGEPNEGLQGQEPMEAPARSEDLFRVWAAPRYVVHTTTMQHKP